MSALRVLSGKLKQMVVARELIVFGCIHDSRSGAAVEAYHETGYGALLIDREHTALSDETVAEQLRLARALDFPCTVRVAEDCYHELSRTLDQAPDGIFVPRIRSREQVERLIRAVKYPPIGIRGLAGSTCPAGKYMGWGSVPEQIEAFNRDLVVGIQIETAEALADLDGVLSVPGVGIAVIGNDDLSLGMGLPGRLDSPEYIAAVERVIAACERHGVLPGIAGGDPAVISHWVERGMRAIWYASDICAMWAGVQRQLADLRDVLEGAGWESGA